MLLTKRPRCRPALGLLVLSGILVIGKSFGCYFQGRSAGEPTTPRSEVGVPPGWTAAETFDKKYSLVVRDRVLMVLDGGETRPRYVPTTSSELPDGTLCWSADGTLMFDVEQQVISVATDTGEVRYVTSRPVDQDGEPRVSEPGDRFVHDAANNRLYYATYEELLSVSLSDQSETTVLRADTLGSEFEFYWWALRLADRRFYTASIDRIVSCTLDGTVVAEFPLAPPLRTTTTLLLSPDGKTLLAEKYQISTHILTPGERLGCWLLDADTLQVKAELDEGHAFRWSSQGDRIAFLINSEELWVYDVADGSSTKLAYVTPPEGAPDWSRTGGNAPPAWSHDDRMIACGFGTLKSPGHLHYYRVILDLEMKQYVDIPEYWYFHSWSPVPTPFLGSEDP